MAVVADETTTETLVPTGAWPAIPLEWLEVAMQHSPSHVSTIVRIIFLPFVLVLTPGEDLDFKVFRCLPRQLFTSSYIMQ